MSGLFEDDPAEPNDLPPPPDGPGLFGDTLPAPALEAAAEPVHATPYRVLARKYRPTTFDDLIGQEAMVRILRNAFSVGRVAHAFMLTGVRGVGKTTTARIIARAMNCIGPDGTGGPTVTPCGVCANCAAILADRHPDVVEMDAATRNGVNDMREIIKSVRFRPIQARTKIFILDEVHMLSTPAFNALLKTLEEPPPHVKFIFATTEIRKVPITVLSRCQRFDLRRVRISELSAHYGRIAVKETVEVAPEALDLIARAADGSVRDGLSILDQAIAQADGPITTVQVTEMLGLADRDKIFDLMEAVMGGKPATALAITDAAFERGADLGVILQDLLDLLHTVTRLKSIPGLRESQDLPEFERTRGVELADRLAVPVLARAWQMLLKGIGEVETAPDRRAAAEMVLIRLCYVADMPTPGDLVKRLSASPPASSGPGGPPNGGNANGGNGGAGNGGAGNGGAGNGGARAVANGSVIAAGEPAPSPDSPIAGPRLSSFRDIVALVAAQKEAMLHAHLLHSVHLVRFAPPVIEVRQEPDAPRDLCQRLAALLSDLTGARWTVAHSSAPGEPTIAEQGNAADTARRNAAADHPLVKAILEAFPGARIDTVHDRTADAYGLPISLPGSPTSEDAPDMPDFAPPDAEYFDDDPMELDL